MVSKTKPPSHPTDARVIFIIFNIANPAAALSGSGRIVYYQFSAFSIISSGILASGVAPGW